MITSMHAFSRSFHIHRTTGFSAAFLVFSFPLIFFFNALALPNEDSLTQSVNVSSQPPYMNYAKKGSYENEAMFSEVPQWHYYDLFGNKILDGFYMYGLSKDRNSGGSGTDNLSLHPLLLRWLNGLVQVGDIHDNGGILALLGDRMRSKFTPFSFNQSLFAGARYDFFYKQTDVTFLTNRISSTGLYGVTVDVNAKALNADWLTGAHANHKFGDMAILGGTWVNIHHEKSADFSNPFSGVSEDTSIKKIYTGLSLLGLNLNVNLKKIQATGEYLNSQEYLDGDFKPNGGLVAALNARYDLLEKLRLGSELYTIGSRFQTNFSCPYHKNGDDRYNDPLTASMGKYQYSLVEDNDDKDEFPENGRCRYSNYAMNFGNPGDPWFGKQGDPDGSIPESYDRNKNGIWDYKEDFLSYEADPPESKILFDRNNNGIPDEVEDDAYPDYPYVPSYYLPGERYYRYDDIDGKWETKWADSMTHKGLAGGHLYSRFNILQNIDITLGGVIDQSQEKTFQNTYDIVSGVAQSQEYGWEKAMSLYLFAHYKKDIARDKYLIIEDLVRKVQDNIPNHTVNFMVDQVSGSANYYLVPDDLSYRDMFGNAFRAEFSFFQNRGFNFTSSGKYEFQQRSPHLKFNYLGKTLSSFNLINKCEYIILLPFLKDMFLIPKYKNTLEITDSLFNVPYKRNSMTNALYMVLEWKMSEKTAFTGGLHAKKFNDFHDSKENYFEPSFSIQLMIKDRYAGMNMALTTGITRYAYMYDKKDTLHNPLNNPHGVRNNLAAHEIFIKLHAGI
jgi:hypothetical protein